LDKPILCPSITLLTSDGVQYPLKNLKQFESNREPSKLRDIIIEHKLIWNELMNLDDKYFFEENKNAYHVCGFTRHFVETFKVSTINPDFTLLKEVDIETLECLLALGRRNTAFKGMKISKAAVDHKKILILIKQNWAKQVSDEKYVLTPNRCGRSESEIEKLISTFDFYLEYAGILNCAVNYHFHPEVFTRANLIGVKSASDFLNDLAKSK